MKTLWVLSGRLAFWASWPALLVYLYFSKRTRVVVVHGSKLLMVKGWLSGGEWNLPGGGLHWGEDPVAGAIRELREETGLRVDAAQLHPLGKARAHERGHRFWYYGYALELPAQPKITRQRLELTDVAWLDRRKVYEDPRTVQTVKDLLSAFSRE